MVFDIVGNYISLVSVINPIINIALIMHV